jgi:non-heme chloroperoxidase
MTTITDREAGQIDRANATGRRPVVFIHGLWLLPDCWEHWANVFDEAGYAALARRSGDRRGGRPASRAMPQSNRGHVNGVASTIVASKNGS